MLDVAFAPWALAHDRRPRVAGRGGGCARRNPAGGGRSHRRRCFARALEARRFKPKEPARPCTFARPRVPGSTRIVVASGMGERADLTRPRTSGGGRRPSPPRQLSRSFQGSSVAAAELACGTGGGGGRRRDAARLPVRPLSHQREAGGPAEAGEADDAGIGPPRGPRRVGADGSAVARACS